MVGRARAVAGTAGVAALVAGGYVVANPGTVAAVTEAAVAVAGTDYAVVAGLGLLAFGAAVAVAAAGVAGGVEQARPPAPEGLPTGVAPGREIDRLLAGDADPDRRERVRARLREAAVGALMCADGCSRSAAARRVDEGSWTDDPLAAAFLGGDRAGGPGPVARLRAALGTAPGPRRAAAEIDRLDPAGDRP